MRRRAVLSALAAAGALTAHHGAPALAATPEATLPALPAGPLRRLGFGSCIHQDRPQPIWHAILADAPELFVFGGDNVYASTPPWSVGRLQQAYQALAASAGFARLRRSVPVVATWDDHDYGLNDGGAEFPHAALSKQAFLEFWGVPQDDERRNRPGVHHALRIGPQGQRVQLILLDGRSLRSALRRTDQRDAPGRERYLPDPDPTKTMLGAEQWRWLEQQLLQDADVRFIVSGVQVLAEGHGWESWANLPLEKARLLELVKRTRAQGVVFLSGDRHIGAFYRHHAPDSYPLYEMTSSGMTHAWAQASEAGPNRLGELVRDNHFGSIGIDWASRTLTLALKDEQGAIRQQHRIALADLRA